MNVREREIEIENKFLLDLKNYLESSYDLEEELPVHINTVEDLEMISNVSRCLLYAYRKSFEPGREWIGDEDYACQTFEYGSNPYSHITYHIGMSLCEYILDFLNEDSGYHGNQRFVNESGFKDKRIAVLHDQLLGWYQKYNGEDKAKRFLIKE